jgi:hypothetical protein
MAKRRLAGGFEGKRSPLDQVGQGFCVTGLAATSVNAVHIEVQARDMRFETREKKI